MSGNDSTEYEYHLKFWGQIENDNLVERDLGIKEKDFWFSSPEDRDVHKSLLKGIAEKNGVHICFSENEGYAVRLKTIARMTMTLPSGDVESLSYDFGYGYPKDKAERMFMDGGYSCDCNRSSFLREDGVDIQELPCGNSIELQDFKVCFK